MKIAMFVPSLFSQGAEYVTAAIARGLSDAGCEVEVVVSALHAELVRTCNDRRPFSLSDKIRLVEMPFKRARFSISCFRKYILESRPDYFLCNAGPYTFPLALANRSLPYNKRTKVIHIEHGNGGGIDKKGNEACPKQGIFKRIRNASMRIIDAIFTVDSGARIAINKVTGYPLDKIFVVYNPAIDAITDYKISLPPQHKWLKNKTLPTFVAAGALTGFKNFSLLINAFAEVVKQKDCRLVIFGEGSLRQELEKQIKDLGLTDRIDLPGYTDQLPAEIKASTGFVLSSDYESFSIVLVEAMFAGVPIVSTEALYGPKEILSAGMYGEIVPRRNIEKLAQGMLNVLNGEGRRAPREAINEYRVEKIVDRYIDAFNKIGR